MKSQLVEVIAHAYNVAAILALCSIAKIIFQNNTKGTKKTVPFSHIKLFVIL